MKASKSTTGDERHETVAQIRALRQRLWSRYGEMPDSADLIREDRDRADEGGGQLVRHDEVRGT
jgi:hypothetical protein